MNNRILINPKEGMHKVKKMALILNSEIYPTVNEAYGHITLPNIPILALPRPAQDPYAETPRPELCIPQPHGYLKIYWPPTCYKAAKSCLKEMQQVMDWFNNSSMPKMKSWRIRDAIRDIRHCFEEYRWAAFMACWKFEKIY